jgi:hypothetical protein
MSARKSNKKVWVKIWIKEAPNDDVKDRGGSVKGK